MSLKEIREWNEEKRRSRLKELGEEIRTLISTEGTTELLCDENYSPVIDEVIMLFLETCRSAFKEESALKLFSYILDEVGYVSQSMGVVTLRFHDTIEKIEEYRSSAGFEKEALKEELEVRGII